jgi:hypothetical protein
LLERGLGCTLPEQSGIGLPVWRRGPAGRHPDEESSRAGEDTRAPSFLD